MHTTRYRVRPPDPHQTTITAKSSDLPVTLSEAKQHLRIFHGDLDAEIDAALQAATDYCEQCVGRSLRVSTTLVQRYAEWPNNPVALDREPVKSITSVTYYDTAGASQTLASANYRLHQATLAGAYLEFDDDFDAPDIEVRDDAVIVTYVAGYAALADVPAMAKYAIKLKTAELFGDLDERRHAATVRACDDLLRQVDWGAYR